MLVALGWAVGLSGAAVVTRLTRNVVLVRGRAARSAIARRRHGIAHRGRPSGELVGGAPGRRRGGGSGRSSVVPPLVGCGAQDAERGTSADDVRELYGADSRSSDPGSMTADLPARKHA